MEKRPLIIRITAFIALCVYLIGCTSTAETPVLTVAQITSIMSPVPSKTVPPTFTVGISTNTPSPTMTASPTPTSTNTSTPVPPTWTPLPKLSPEEAQAKVMELIATNGGCKLPCWWGITPGETSWEQARQFLTSFSEIDELRENVYIVNYFVEKENGLVVSSFATISTGEGLVQEIEAGVYYPLDQVLELYGQPDEVRVYVDNQSIDKLAPFVIALYYGEQGFLANYGGRTEKGEINQICPNVIEGRASVWFLWSPELEMTFDIAGRKELLFVSPSDRRFRKVEQVTNMDARQFYEMYRDPANLSKCFDFKVPKK